MTKPKPRTWKHRLSRLLRGTLVCYLGILLVLLFFENRLLYHPARANEDWAAPPNELVQDVELSADGVKIHAWWCPPPGWKPEHGAMLYCHGNAGNLSHRGGAIADWQRERAEAVLIFDYPGYGRSEGAPSEAGCYAATDAAYDWLTEVQKVRPEAVILLGRSLGGGAAAHLAVSRPHRALVLLCAFTSVPDMAQQMFPWLPCRWLVRNRFENLSRIKQCRGPLLIAHGTADEVVPFTHGERLFAAANEPKHFFAMPGEGHNAALGPDFFQALREFLGER